jgi:hypothetical protein
MAKKQTCMVGAYECVCKFTTAGDFSAGTESRKAVANGNRTTGPIRVASNHWKSERQGGSGTTGLSGNPWRPALYGGQARRIAWRDRANDGAAHEAARGPSCKDRSDGDRGSSDGNQVENLSQFHKRCNAGCRCNVFLPVECKKTIWIRELN